MNITRRNFFKKSALTAIFAGIAAYVAPKLAASKPVEVAQNTSRVDVKNVIDAIHRDFETIKNSYVFEQNDFSLREKCKLLISNTMEKYTTDRIICNYRVTCDETNNTPSVLKSGNLKIDVAFQPNNVVYYVVVKGDIYG